MVILDVDMGFYIKRDYTMGSSKLPVMLGHFDPQDSLHVGSF